VAIQQTSDPVSPMAGIVTYLTEVEFGRGDPDLFVAAARGPDMAVLGYPTGTDLVGSGAGLRWEDARGAAVGECLERYASCLVDVDELLIASYDTLVRSGRVAHEPSVWALFDPLQRVPYPAFTGDRTVAWVEGRDLVTGDTVHILACLAYLG
jgi:YcaO cyclodehydratase, ATP-ad Mg2+-binding